MGPNRSWVRCDKRNSVSVMAPASPLPALTTLQNPLQPVVADDDPSVEVDAN
jgi:hypothetical protein